MYNYDIVSLIKNLIAEQAPPEKAIKQLETLDDVQDIAETLFQLLEDEVNDDVVVTSPAYNWSAPQLPSVQIEPFSPKDISTPDGLTLLSQNIELAADGGITVTATISCNDVVGAAEYEFRLSGG